MTTTDFRGAHPSIDTQASAGAPDQTSDSTRAVTDLHMVTVESEQTRATTTEVPDPNPGPSSRATLPAANSFAQPISGPRRDHSSTSAIDVTDTQVTPADVEHTSDPATGYTHPHPGAAGSEQTAREGHVLPATQVMDALAGSDFPADHAEHGLHSPAVGGDQTEDGSAASFGPDPRVETLADPFLALAADIVDDLERTRIANENRLRMLTRTEVDEDGEMRGLGMDERDPNVARTAALVDMLAKAEHQAILNLNKLLREHPLGPWIKTQKGVGEKTAARLLAVVGDPYVNLQTGEVRTISQLWAYCGHGDPGRRKFKGMTQDDLFRLGNPTAKKRVWLIATAILKAGGGEEKATGAPLTQAAAASLAAVYYARKAATEAREHAAECVRCGPSGKPALPGSPWSDAHRHADALRIVGKEFLRELWLEAKRLHEESP